ncbi:hypothetical protein [Nostoc sp. ChiSLP03a]|nr:hypothetical protein [Nostoc sp. ChiSLP03a]MDZ8215582.1 hypothetical protein [Nostoc sp. ChiSLP03a]
MSNTDELSTRKKAKLMSDAAMVAIALPRKNGGLFSICLIEKCT